MTDSELVQLAMLWAHADDRVKKLAVMYAVDMDLYGVDVTEKLETATELHYALMKAERAGYRKALEDMRVRMEDRTSGKEEGGSGQSADGAEVVRRKHLFGVRV